MPNNVVKSVPFIVVIYRLTPEKMREWISTGIEGRPNTYDDSWRLNFWIIGHRTVPGCSRVVPRMTATLDLGHIEGNRMMCTGEPLPGKCRPATTEAPRRPPPSVSIEYPQNDSNCSEVDKRVRKNHIPVYGTDPGVLPQRVGSLEENADDHHQAGHKESAHQQPVEQR